MAPPKKDSVTGKWWEKPLSIKPNGGIPERIAAFLNKYTGPPPANAKEFITTLLDASETAISKDAHDAALFALRAENTNQKDDIDALEDKYEGLLEKTERLREETNGLLSETKGLREENQRLLNPETIYNEWFTGLRQLAPHLVNAADKTPLDTLNRLLFLVSETDEAVNQQKQIAETLTDELQKEKTKQVNVKPNEAIISFTPEHLANIRLVRKCMAEMGHRFTSDEPEEVIHAAIAAQLENTKQMIDMCKDYSPLIGLL